MQALDLRRVTSSADLASPGDFVFIPNCEPSRKVVTRPIDPPYGFFKKLIWTVVGKKFDLREELEPRWPEYDAIVLLCPHCSMPLATTKSHHIVSLDPVTLDIPLACEYSRSRGVTGDENDSTASFEINEGKIITE
jgi:hypothetical protein